MQDDVVHILLRLVSTRVQLNGVRPVKLSCQNPEQLFIFKDGDVVETMEPGERSDNVASRTGGPENMEISSQLRVSDM
jgi:hypothetical protein